MKIEIVTTYYLGEFDNVSVCDHAENGISLSCSAFDGFVIYMSPEQAERLVGNISNTLRARKKIEKLRKNELGKEVD